MLLLLLRRLLLLLTRDRRRGVSNKDRGGRGRRWSVVDDAGSTG